MRVRARSSVNALIPWGGVGVGRFAEADEVGSEVVELVAEFAELPLPVGLPVRAGAGAVQPQDRRCVDQYRLEQPEGDVGDRDVAGGDGDIHEDAPAAVKGCSMPGNSGSLGGLCPQMLMAS